MKLISLNLYQTVAVAVVVFYGGNFLKKKVNAFQKYCIPAPVIGGIIFALMTLGLNLAGIMTIETDETMKNVFQTLFFTSVGYTASLKLLKKGGLQVAIFVVITTLIVIGQDVLGVIMAYLFDLDPTIGLCTGSIAMVGGHGTSASFGPLLENQYGVSGAYTIAIAAATFGLVMGGLIGGPIAKRLISKKKLSSEVFENPQHMDDFSEEKLERHLETDEFLKAFSMLFLAAGIGTVISALIEKTGITFPSYIGAMLAAALIRNLSDVTQKFNVMENVVSLLGSVSLSLFLSMALMGLKLWELASLAVPMIVMLMVQTVFIGAFAYFVTFNVMGKDYEAAVMSSACCGFGMGATPNAIANMQAITGIYGPAPKAFFIVPLVGSLFIDFINGFVVTFFINLLK